MSSSVTHSQASRPSCFRLLSAAPSSSSFEAGVEKYTFWAMRSGSAPASTSSCARPKVEACVEP